MLISHPMSLVHDLLFQWLSYVATETGIQVDVGQFWKASVDVLQDM